MVCATRYCVLITDTVFDVCYQILRLTNKHCICHVLLYIAFYQQAPYLPCATIYFILLTNTEFAFPSRNCVLSTGNVFVLCYHILRLINRHSICLLLANIASYQRTLYLNYATRYCVLSAGTVFELRYQILRHQRALYLSCDTRYCVLSTGTIFVLCYLILRLINRHCIWIVLPDTCVFSIGNIFALHNLILGLTNRHCIWIVRPIASYQQTLYLPCGTRYCVLSTGPIFVLCYLILHLINEHYICL